MTYQSYSRGIRIIFTILGVLLMMHQLGKAYFQDQQLILAFLYFAVRFVILYLLFFSIYASLSKIKNLRILESPLIFIVIAFIFIVPTFVTPIAFYISSSRHSEFNFSDHNLSSVELRNKVMDANVHVTERHLLARNYYLDTGDRLTYLGDNNKEIVFTPDENALKLYSSTASLRVAKANLKITAFALIGIFIVSAMCFVIFLWYRYPLPENRQH